jgi:nitrogen fixation NifU-like protein
MYSDIVLEHFRQPHNVGVLPEATATVEVVNPVCGDILRLSVQAADERIVAARFKTQGCVTSIAASSMLTDLLTGSNFSEASKITAEKVAESLGGLPPATFHAAQLCADGVAALLSEFKR